MKPLCTCLDPKPSENDGTVDYERGFIETCANQTEGVLAKCMELWAEGLRTSPKFRVVWEDLGCPRALPTDVSVDARLRPQKPMSCQVSGLLAWFGGFRFMGVSFTEGLRLFGWALEGLGFNSACCASFHRMFLKSTMVVTNTVPL